MRILLTIALYLSLLVFVHAHELEKIRMTEDSAMAQSWWKLGQAEGIRAEIETLEAQLAAIPKTRISTVQWTFGYRTGNYKNPNREVIVTVQYDEAHPVDLIVLMPFSYMGEENRVRSVGFPKRFRIEQTFSDGSRKVVADFSETPYPLEGYEPQLFPCHGTPPSDGLKVTVYELGDNFEIVGDTYAFILNEILAFSGNENVALNAKIKVQPNRRENRLWEPQALVDGHLPFVPVAQRYYRRQDQFESRMDPLILELDLGSERRVDGFKLWPTSYFLQNKYPDIHGFGFPTEIRFSKIEKLKDPDPGQLLFNSMPSDPNPGTGPLSRSIEPVTGRFFRFSMSNPFHSALSETEMRLSEIQLLSEGDVVSGEIIPSFYSPNQQPKLRNIHALTDGSTAMGDIIPLRSWIEQFNRAAILERKIHRLERDLDSAIQADRNRLNIIFLAFCAACFVFMSFIWIIRLLNKAKVSQLKEDIACEIHDEIGANLSSIAHSYELLGRTIQAPSPLQAELLEDSRKTIQSTAEEARGIVNLLEAQSKDLSVLSEMRSIADQMLIGIEYSLDIENSALFKKLNSKQKWHLLLFFKEALNNILKHAKASDVSISLIKNATEMELIVSDNGIGLSAERLPLRHLESRARKIGGELTVDSAAQQGTKINLRFTPYSDV